MKAVTCGYYADGTPCDYPTEALPVINAIMRNEELQKQHGIKSVRLYYSTPEGGQGWLEFKAKVTA
jgi:hypothetical protein